MLSLFLKIKGHFKRQKNHTEILGKIVFQYEPETV